MGRSTRAKKPKKKKPTTQEQLETLLKQYSKEIGKSVVVITEEEIENIKQDTIKTTIKSATALLEYNMILENHLTPKEAKRQGELMDIRAQAIVDGNLSWDDVNAFLKEHYEKEEQDANKQQAEGS